MLPINKQNRLGCQRLFYSQCIPFSPLPFISAMGGIPPFQPLALSLQELLLRLLASSCLRDSHLWACCTAPGVFFLPASLILLFFPLGFLPSSLGSSLSISDTQILLLHPRLSPPALLSCSVAAPMFSTQRISSSHLFILSICGVCVSGRIFIYILICRLHKIPIQSRAGWGDPDAQEEMFHISRSTVCAPQQPLLPTYQM